MKERLGLYHFTAIAIVAVWGLTYISTKVLMQNGLQPQEIFFYRFLIAFIGSWFIAPRKFFSKSWKDEAFMLLAGLSGGSMYFYTENTAIGMTQVSNVAFLLCMAPLFTTLLSIMFHKEEKATLGIICGSLLALVGVAMIVFDGSTTLKVSPIGDILTLAATLLWACYSLIIRRLSRRYSTVFITRKVFFYGVLTILPVFIFHPFSPNYEILSQPAVFTNLLFLAVVASLGCFVLWNVTLKKLGTMRASNYLYLTPIVSLTGSIIILDERMTIMALVGAALIMAGVYWAETK